MENADTYIAKDENGENYYVYKGKRCLKDTYYYRNRRDRKVLLANEEYAVQEVCSYIMR